MESYLPRIESCPACLDHSEKREVCKFHAIVKVEDPEWPAWPAVILNRQNENEALIKYLAWEKTDSITVVPTSFLSRLSNGHVWTTNEADIKTDIQTHLNAGYNTNFNLPNTPILYHCTFEKNEADIKSPMMSPTLPNERLCKLCAKSSANFTCGNCSRVAYCSPACQQSDWPIHSQGCLDVNETIKLTEPGNNEKHSQKPSKCPICDKYYRNVNSLKMHLRSVHKFKADDTKKLLESQKFEIHEIESIPFPDYYELQMFKNLQAAAISVDNGLYSLGPSSQESASAPVVEKSSEEIILNIPPPERLLVEPMSPVYKRTEDLDHNQNVNRCQVSSAKPSKPIQQEQEGYKIFFIFRTSLGQNI